MGVIGQGLFSPVIQVTPQWLSNCPPLFPWQACPCALAVNSGFLANFGFSSFWMEGMKPPLYGQQGSLFWWVGVFCVREGDRHCHPSWHRGYLPISLLPSLALPTMTQFSEWSYSFWGSLSASINGPWLLPSTTHACSFWGQWPHHFT